MGVPHRERGRRMDEMLEAVTALWAGDNVTYEGKYYRFENLTIDPKPIQKPHPPIWIGGGTQPSEKIYGQTVASIDPVLRRIARYARTWVRTPRRPPRWSGATGRRSSASWASSAGSPTRCPGSTRTSSGYSGRGEARVGGAALQGLLGDGPRLLAGVLPAGRGRRAGRPDPGQDRSPGRMRVARAEPPRLGAEQLELLAGEVLPRVAKP